MVKKTDFGYTYNKYKDSIFKFGKHNGKTYLEVLERNPKYIDWIITTEQFYYKNIPIELRKFKDAYNQIKKKENSNIAEMDILDLIRIGVWDVE
jgi:hypothetical protein